jgi:hypothetical protein
MDDGECIELILTSFIFTQNLNERCFLKCESQSILPTPALIINDLHKWYWLSLVLIVFLHLKSTLLVPTFDDIVWSTHPTYNNQLESTQFSYIAS